MAAIPEANRQPTGTAEGTSQDFAFLSRFSSRAIINWADKLAMTIIRYDSIFPILDHAVPGYEPSESDRREPLPYMIMQEMMTFVCERASSSSIEAEQFSVLLEKLIIEGDEETQYLVLDTLEGLWGYRSRGRIAEFFGPRTRSIWQVVSDPSYSPDSIS